MKFDIGKPEHGWVKVRAEIGDDIIEFDASDVPNDPIEHLIDAIRISVAGRSASVWWNLEPDGWFFDFEPVPQGLRIRALYASGSDKSKAVIRAEAQGSKASILLPLWRALRKFESYHPSEPHWPALEEGAIVSLRKFIE